MKMIKLTKKMIKLTKKMMTMSLALVAIALNAQPPADTSPTSPSGATYVLSNGSTVTLNDQSLSSSTQYYNVVQVTNGTLNLYNCDFTKSGDGSSGDNSSFYGNNSSVYAGGSNAHLNIYGCTITSNSQGANGVIAYNGSTVNIDGITIDNTSSVSRGLHATYGGSITAYNVDITTRSQTSSTIATDRGGGTVYVNTGTALAKGAHSAVLYSTGTITAINLNGTSEQGEIAVVEGDNGVVIENCTMTSGSANRGMMLLQSGSGDAQGVNAYITVTNSSLTMTDSNAPLIEVPTLNNGTVTLTDVTLDVPSGRLMYVDYNTQWKTYGGYGHLNLYTTQDSWSYTGLVDADSYSNVTVTVGENVTWNGGIDADNNAASSVVTVDAGGVWVLTGDSYVDQLVNNGIIYTNGYELHYDSMSGNGSVIEGSAGPGIIANPSSLSFNGTVGSMMTKTFTVKGSDLTDGLTLTLSDESGMFGLSETTISLTDALVGKAVTVTYAPTTFGTNNASVTISGGGATAVTVNLTGTATLTKYAPVMQPAAEEHINLTRFRADWTDETPAANVESYTLWVYRYVEPEVVAEEVAAADFTSFNAAGQQNTPVSDLDAYCSPAGWTGTVYPGQGGVKLGASTSNVVGTLTTPAIDLSKSGGKLTITFNAKTYSGGGGGGNSTAASLVIQTGGHSFTQALTTTSTTYTVVLDCEALEGQTLSFTSANNRVLLSSISVTTTDVTAASLNAAIETGDATERIITGITDKSYTVANLNENDTYYFKVKTIYVDGTQSEWSNIEEVTLFQNCNDYEVGDVNGDGNVNISDVTALINYLLSGNAAGVNLGGADVNRDGNVNISDVTALINYLLSGTW